MENQVDNPITVPIVILLLQWNMALIKALSAIGVKSASVNSRMMIPPSTWKRMLMSYHLLSTCITRVWVSAAIRRHLHQEHDHAPSTATIYEWIQKYTQYAIDSVKGYRPQVGNVWIADETVLKIDGAYVWFWDIIDDKTRFLIASRVSRSRTTQDAQMLIDRAIKTAGNNVRKTKPEKGGVNG